MGDDFLTYGFPFIDVDSGGSINGMIHALEKVIPMLPEDVKVIPGHGSVSNLDDVRVHVKMLKETRDVVQKALKEGKTFEQMKQARILTPWKRYAWGRVPGDALQFTDGPEERQVRQTQLTPLQRPVLAQWRRGQFLQ
jgi:cyclase